MNKVIRIGAVSATFVDSRMAMPQLLRGGGALDFMVFDNLSEGVMGNLARAQAAGQPGWVADFVDGQVGPYLQEIVDRKIRVIANAGGLDPVGCGEALRARAARDGLHPRIAVVVGDDLRARVDELVTPGTRDMFDGSDIRAKLDQADKVMSCSVYTGAFPIAAALDAGADIVITGRAVDSAAALGALIHSFGWGLDDSDLLASGTLIGHLIECSTQVTGGTFTDWRDVPDWANIGWPIAECEADGSAVITKPDGTGGLISTATVAEQLLYEVSDPQRYIVPDVICDFTAVTLTQQAKDRVGVSGARGLGRPEMLKATLTWDQGWRSSAVMPVIGREAAAKARRIADELFARVSRMLRERQMGPLTLTHCDVVGGEGEGASVAIYRIVADHDDPQALALFAREQSTIMTSMAVGTSAPLGRDIRPLQWIAGFLCPRATVDLKVLLDGEPVAFSAPPHGTQIDAAAPPMPAAPDQPATGGTVPLIRLAWARSGDKGNLFNVGVIARKPGYLPYIAAALGEQVVGAHYGRLLGDGTPLPVERFSVPGFHAINLVVGDSLCGGMLASPAIDPAAKGMAQLLLDFPVPVSAAIAADIAADIAAGIASNPGPGA